MLTQAEKAKAFRILHACGGAFLIPNPWDRGTARLLAHLGFEALASTSAGYGFSLGQQDNTIGRDQMLVYLAAMAGATDLPVSADLENGYGDDPETVAESCGTGCLETCGVVRAILASTTRYRRFGPIVHASRFP